jgi:hypothetical protein
MSRIERLKQYANPTRPGNWQGAGRDQANIDRWVERASANSDGDRHRAKDGPIDLPATGRRVETRDTGMAPKVSRKVDAAMKAAKGDVNHVGSGYLKNVRRSES